MSMKRIAVFAALCACVGTALFFYTKRGLGEQSEYVLFNPVMTAEQKNDVQQQIDQQLSRRPQGQQVSSTQVAYDQGAVVITFPVPGDANKNDQSCGYGYFCVWEHPNYLGRKVAVISDPHKNPVNLADYNMSLQVSSWKYNNKAYATIVYGVDGANGRGKVMTTTLKEIDPGQECCPFNIPEKTKDWTEIYSVRHLEGYGDRIVSIKVSPLFGGANM